MRSKNSDRSVVFQPVVFRSLGEAWVHCLARVIRGNLIHDDDERLWELRNVSFSVLSVDEKDPIIRKYADPSRLDLMKEKYSSCSIVGDYKISYGKLLYDNDGIDQIEWVTQRLLAKPETKSATISLHRPGEEELSCLSLLDFKLRKGVLDMTAVYRSQNVFGSQPGNLVAMHLIQEFVASRLGAAVGALHLTACSAHIYESDLSKVKAVVRSVVEKGQTTEENCEDSRDSRP